ncbi:uncharacterized protein B0J16DRAFT_47024 [Fusarium flagelliforme]|uniref:Uncharacterized protein n=1 Tax=Fusarium flagelliforme TaxID=2675880 RepID=A0A395MQL9_9HYPO|nr:uncharacterized protein B0J16DRAFT_47024 [Fusarium flagelliforme]KAH7198850.1 hypothetical protein B0J16DRAFT_47024 [Fusarium flagelliforme]RFN50202.1 hypothetical protein FIE12Z_5516 [Fusarium flagelliforme]
MAHDPRTTYFLSQVTLTPPLRLTRLTTPPSQDFFYQSSPNSEIAHNLLVQARVISPNYIAPERQKLHFLRSEKQRAAACDTSTWTFTKHEVAIAFGTLMEQPVLPPAGVAQALLMNGNLGSLEELWAHLGDATLEKRMKSKRLSVEFDVLKMGWLDKAVAHDNLNYIHLLCQTKVSQESLDRAFGIALSKMSLRAMKLLLSFGAVASGYGEVINKQIKDRNLELVELLLSAPDSMDGATWKECLDGELSRAETGEILSISFLLLLLSNRPGLVSESLLLSTLRLHNVQATAIVLAYATSNEIFFNIRHQACELASQCQNDNDRFMLFKLLSDSDLVGDSLPLREELVKDTRARHIPLVKLLVQAGVEVDEALSWAISYVDIELIEVLDCGNRPSSSTRIVTGGVSEQSD